MQRKILFYRNQKNPLPHQMQYTKGNPDLHNEEVFSYSLRDFWEFDSSETTRWVLRETVAQVSDELCKIYDLKASGPDQKTIDLLLENNPQVNNFTFALQEIGLVSTDERKNKHIDETRTILQTLRKRRLADWGTRQATFVRKSIRVARIFLCCNLIESMANCSMCCGDYLYGYQQLDN